MARAKKSSNTDESLIFDVVSFVSALIYANKPHNLAPILITSEDMYPVDLKEAIINEFTAQIIDHEGQEEAAARGQKCPYKYYWKFNMLPLDFNECISDDPSELNVFINFGASWDMCKVNRTGFLELLRSKSYGGVPLPRNTYYLYISDAVYPARNLGKDLYDEMAKVVINEDPGRKAAREEWTRDLQEYVNSIRRGDRR